MRLRIIATEAPYDTLLANIKALSGKPYSVNEVKKFPFRTFFVNPEIEDGQTRLVIEMENQALALEIPKEKYEILKSLLLGRTETTTIPVVKQPIVKKPESPKIIPPKTVTETKTGSTQSGKTR